MDRRVIVIGGGILGAAVTYRLTRAGAAVTLIDAGTLGHGTTLTSFAWLNASNKPPLPYHLLNVAGMNEYSRLQAELGGTWLHQSGHIVWDLEEEGAAKLTEKVSRLQSWGYAAEWLPVRDLASLEPDLVAPDGLESFAYFPDEGYVDAVHLVGYLLGAAKAAGATVRDGTPVKTIVVDSGRATGVELGNGERLDADVVVSCVGRWSQTFLDRLGIGFAMAPTVGMTAVTAPAAVRLRSILHTESVDIRPDGAGRIMLCHDDFDLQATPGEPVDPSLLIELRDRAAKVLPGLSTVPVEVAHVAIRPIPGDKFTAAGNVPGVEGLYLAVTHSAVTLGPLLGRLLSQEIMFGERDARLDTFRPDRLIGAAVGA